MSGAAKQTPMICDGKDFYHTTRVYVTCFFYKFAVWTELKYITTSTTLVAKPH